MLSLSKYYDKDLKELDIKVYTDFNALKKL